MKLKYNHNGQTESISLTKKKPEGKRLAIHHDGENFYAPLADAGDATASNLRTTFKGEILAVRALPPPEIENILIAPPRVSVMQGQSATAIVSAEGNEAVAGLSYSLTNPPTWITISDDMILIRPSDNDLGEAIVEVIAKDTGSDASMSAAFVAESLLRPIIESLSVIPPAVTVSQGSTSTAIVQAVANSAVGGLSYSLDGAPSWVRNDNDTIWVEPTTNDTGTSTVQVVAYDTNSSARADTEFVAEAKMPPEITYMYWDYPLFFYNGCYYVNQGETATFTLQAGYNAAVTGIEYSLENAPSWMTLSGNKIICAPTTNDTDTATITVVARDIGSTAQYSMEKVVKAQPKPTITRLSTGNTIYSNSGVSNEIWVVAYDASGNSVPYEALSASQGNSTYGCTAVAASSLTDSHQINVTCTGGNSLWFSTYVKEASGAISYKGCTIPIVAATQLEASLSPAQATLVTGTSGNQTVYIKATTKQKVVAYWNISGCFPKNSTITPGQGYTSASSLASVKVVYPKKDQHTYSANYWENICISASPTSAMYAKLSTNLPWIKHSSSNATYYKYK